MLIELGNPNPHEIIDGINSPLSGPAVTTIGVTDAKNEDGSYVSGYITGTDPVDVLRQFAVHRGGVMKFGGNELVQDVIGSWDSHSIEPPTWVNVVPEGRDPAESEDFERFLAEYWGAERGKPEDFEDTHVTQYGDVVYAAGEKPEGT